MFGVVRRVPRLHVDNETVVLAPGVSLESVIVGAASARRWSPQVTSPGLVRCRFVHGSWSITVDVRHSDSEFSVEYVDSSGLFYRSDADDIHGTYNKQVDALRRQIHKVAASRAVSAARAATPAATPAAPAPAAAPAVKPYNVSRLARKPGGGFSYECSIDLSEGVVADIALSRRIQAEIRDLVRAEYAAAVSDGGAKSASVEFPRYEMHDRKVEGEARVLAVELLEFVYDPDTRHGRLAVKVAPGRYEATRQWVRANLGTIAREKNPGLLNSLSGASKFKTEREMLRGDGVLEVEFSTGD